MQRWLVQCVASALVALAAAVGLPVLEDQLALTTPSFAQAVAPVACANAVALAVPGAGEGDTGATTSSAGRTLQPLLHQLVAAAAARGRSVRTVAIQAATPSPAALLGRGTGRTPATEAVTRRAWGAWREPLPRLVSGLRASLSEATANCPDQLIYLIGYSQGAEAVHRLLAGGVSADVRTRVVGVVLVADPARVAHSRGRIVGAPAASRRSQGVSARLARRPAPAVPTPGWLAPVRQVCSQADVACDLSRASFRVSRRIHLSYRETEMRSRLVTIGTGLGRRLGQWPVPLAAGTVSGRVGMVLSERLRASVAAGARDDLRWSARSDLPAGLALDERGLLSGSPRDAGTFSVQYAVRNTSSAAVSRPMSGQVTVRIEPELPSQTSAGGGHTCAVRKVGTLWCWGANDYGQLGVGTTRASTVPVQVGTATTWAAVSSGGKHTCAVRENGSLWCWGLNFRGQLGLGGRSDQVKPQRVGADSDWASVSAGWVHTCASRLDGSAWCWGNNAHGQLGDGSLTSVFEPSRVARARTWLDIEAGGWNTCGVQGDGSAWCWGRNSSGEVGDGTTISRRFPTRVGQDVHWVSLQPSWTHTCGLRADGAVRCWGGNEGGQLGSASGSQSVVPRTVAGDHTWSSVSTGAGFTCATNTDLAVWCWGTGRYGQLGSPTSRSDIPTRVTAVGAGTGLDLGWLHACVSGATGRPQCWGSNETGQLGDRTTSDRSGIEAAVPEPTTSSASRRDATGFDFNLVTMNVLGSNHTAPGSNSSEFSPARIRSEWMVDYLASRNASVVGFQEIQRDQLAWFVRGAGSEYAVWPGTQIGPAGVQTTIAWKKSTWRLLETDYVEIPFITQRRLMPLVRLEHRATGRAVWVMNVHNAPQDWQAQRNTAVETEIRRLKRVIGQGDPVFLIGDFNERHRVFCEVTGRLDFVAPRGGSNVDGTCKPPSGLNRVDWIFGSDDVRYSGYAEDRSTLVGRITDHAVLRTRVSVP